MSLSIVLTCYNETPIIFESYEKIVDMMNITKIDHELIIVNDGSAPEATGKMKEYFREKPHTIFISSETNEGRGAAVTRGMKAASKDYVGFIDTDLEIPEYSLLTLYHAIVSQKADVVLGRRSYVMRWGLNAFLRYVCSRMYFWCESLFLHLGFLDTATGIKIFDRRKVLPVLDLVRDKRWFWDTEIVAECLYNNMKIVQAPVFVIRKEKPSSVRLVRDTRRYLSSLYEYRKRHLKASDER
ncbi:MAG: glycosyltransferase family 2 protein [Candidatus Omnitrophota bacterium]